MARPQDAPPAGPALARPAFDEFAARSALRSLLFAGLVVSAPALIRPEFARYYLLQGGVLLASAAVLYAVRRRFAPRTLARAVIGVGAMVVALAAWVSGGAFSPAYHAYAVTMVGASWLVSNPRMALAATLAISGIGAALAAATSAGWTPDPWIVHSSWTSWATTSSAGAIMAVIQWLEVHRLRDANERLNAELELRARTELALTESQAALKQSLATLQGALESTVDGLMIVDTSGRVVAYNQKFQALWRMPDAVARRHDAEEMRAHVLPQVVDPDQFRVRVAQIYADPDAVSFDTLDLVDGRRFERYSQPQVVDGVVAGRVWSFRDVTDRTREEHRRAELEQALRQAQTLEALGALAGGIAHDFNNLLMIIGANAEQARVDPDPAVRDASLGAIEQAAGRAAGLVREIREFSRPRAAARSVVAVADAIGSALRLLQTTMPKHLVVDARLAPGVTMFADGTQVQQVVTNLVLNAAQALGETPGHILVELDDVGSGDVPDDTPRPRAERYARLTVRDTGPGIPAEALPQLFRPYFTTRTGDGGSGLGLAVVQGIVRRHHGAIAVETAAGRGTTFRIFWPALPPSTTPAAPPPAQADDRTPRGDGRHVLVVDDEPDIVAVVTAALRRLGYRTTGCTDPTEALARFTAAPGDFDAVLSDLSMPVLSGVTLGRRVRDVRPDTPVVLFTGHAADLSPDEARAAGFAAVLNKPMTAAALAEVLHRALPPAAAPPN